MAVGFYARFDHSLDFVRPLFDPFDAYDYPAGRVTEELVSSRENHKAHLLSEKVRWGRA
jgi:hypothetical protein